MRLADRPPSCERRQGSSTDGGRCGCSRPRYGARRVRFVGRAVAVEAGVGFTLLTLLVGVAALAGIGLTARIAAP
jgi:hypothetical protein